MTAPNVLYVLPDKMGGMMNVVASLLANRVDDGMLHHAVLTHNTLSTDTRFEQPLEADSQTTVEYTLPVENLRTVLDRLRRALPPGGGVLVTNDLLELALLHVHDPGRMVVQILHGDYDYYYDLAAKHDAVIDGFVAISRAIFETLRRRLPHRAEDVHYLPYGVPLPARVRHGSDGPLRLVFAGRVEDQKGVFDLPAIDRLLRDRGIGCHWTIIGDGIDTPRLREVWREGLVDWRGVRPHAEVLATLPDFDLFVLPSRAEGFPLALVEGMAAGLVPIVSDLASGVPEIVDPGVTGFRPAVGDVAGFADAISTLAHDRARLDAMSRAARAIVETRFDARERTRAYQALYARWEALRRPRPAQVPLPYGSRLDRAWIPNPLVRAIRTAVRWRQGKPT